jgi:very-short-patch-repair endonuclease
MPVPQHIVTGQAVTAEYRQRARRLRRNMTPEERCLWQALRRHALQGYHFRRQQIVGSYILDFYCHAAGVGVEIDGAYHRAQRAYDAVRDADLAAQHIRVLRFTNDDVMTALPRVLADIAGVCQEQMRTHAHDA